MEFLNIQSMLPCIYNFHHNYIGNQPYTCIPLASVGVQLSYIYFQIYINFVVAIVVMTENNCTFDKTLKII